MFQIHNLIFIVLITEVEKTVSGFPPLFCLRFPLPGNRNQDITITNHMFLAQSVKIKLIPSHFLFSRQNI